MELIGSKPVARTICDQAVVIFRGEDGEVGILSDRCPHRFAPLSSGEVSGNSIQCGYHGIKSRPRWRVREYSGQSSCSEWLFGEALSCRRKARLCLDSGWASASADPAPCPDFHENHDPSWAPVPGYMNESPPTIRCWSSNPLDLTHVVFVRQDDAGRRWWPTDTPLEVRGRGRQGVAQRMMIDRRYRADLSTLHVALNGKIDRWQIFEYSAPVYVKTHARCARGRPDTPLGVPVHMVLNGLPRRRLKTARIISGRRRGNGRWTTRKWTSFIAQ